MLDGTSKIQIKRKIPKSNGTDSDNRGNLNSAGIYGGVANVTAAIDRPLSRMPPRNHSDTARDYLRLHGLRVRFLPWT